MAIRKLKPVTAASRGTQLVDYSELWRGKPEKSLVFGKSSSGGRNSTGRITVRHRGGGHKRALRVVDIKRSAHDGVKCTVERIEYDPGRSAFIALVSYENGSKSYILAPQELKKGDEIFSGPESDLLVGCALDLKDIPVGTNVYNIELKPRGGGKLVRSAGCGARIAGRDGAYTIILLPSGRKKLILSSCRATIGSVSNPDNKNVKSGSAGRLRHLGFRPRVRGVAMNPVDHPMGGGEGKTSGGRHPVSFSGIPAKGKKTRKAYKDKRMKKRKMM